MSGRPPGTRNKPGHTAGGSRPGAGRKKNVLNMANMDIQLGEPMDTSPDALPEATSTFLGTSSKWDAAFYMIKLC
jgi:hypothetical protein